jgi:hypothetical protein
VREPLRAAEALDPHARDIGGHGRRVPPRRRP